MADKHEPLEDIGSAIVAVGETMLDSEPFHDRGRRQSDLLNRVEYVCRLKEEGADVSRHAAPWPFGGYLRVARRKGRRAEVFPVAALEGTPSGELVEVFTADIDARYRERDRFVRSTLVYDGDPAPESLLLDAAGCGVDLVPFAEYEGLVDLTGYVQRQTARIEHDLIYPPSLYIDQRAAQVIGRSEHALPSALSAVTSWLTGPHPCFVLVLADFGTGKTFLLREIARRLATSGSPVVPVLIELRRLQKQRSLDHLLADHFAADMRTIPLDNLRYMVDEGKIALLFDGFDELESRVSYARAVEHFEAIAQAARGKAKIVLTSRTQHFLTDDDIKRELGLRVDATQGARIVKLQSFADIEIRKFLARKLESPEKADRRFALLEEVKDLLGLSKNPRMLSFIADLPEERLLAARDRAGGTITAATLYGELLDRWLGGEVARTNLPGALPGLDAGQRRRAVRALAERLWLSGDPSLDLSELPAELQPALDAMAPRGMDRATMVAQVGSGTLLVRDDVGRFSFLHRSVGEFLVADAAAESVRSQVERGAVERHDCAVLSQREMSHLMADFLADLAVNETAIAWGRAVLGQQAEGAVAANARLLLRRLGLTPYKGAVLTKQELRGQDLARQDLSGADLTGADLSGATLVAADLTGARLRGARLVRANLDGALLKDADLRGADLSGARLIGADLRGAKLGGAVLRHARLIAARVDPGALAAADTFCAVPVIPPPPLPATLPVLLACNAVAVSPDGALLASAHGGGMLGLWDAATGALLRAFRAHDETSTCVTFSPDGLTLASGSNDRTIRLWSTSGGSPLHVLRGHESKITGVAFSPDGLTLASGSNDQTVRLWSIALGTPIGCFEGHSDWVTSVAFSPDGKTLASGSRSCSVRLWNVLDGSVAPSLRGHLGSVNGVTFSRDGKTLASASSDTTARLWNALDGTPFRVLEGHTLPLNGIAFIGDGLTVVTGANDRSLRLWNVPDGAALRSLEGRSNPVTGVAFNPDGRTLAASSADGAVRLWAVLRGATVDSRSMSFGGLVAITSIAFSPDGRNVATGSSNKVVALWDSKDRAWSHRLHGHSNGVTSVAFSPDGRTLASGSHDKLALLWNLADGSPTTPRGTLAGHADSVLSVAFSPDGHSLATGSDDASVRFWSVRDASPLRSLQGHSGPVRSIAFAPDGRTLASASYDQSVRLWNVADGSLLRAFAGHSGTVTSVAFAPDGKTLATGSTDSSVRLWSVLDCNETKILHGHSNPVTSVAFHPDGRFVASASDDNTLRLWSIAGHCLAILHATPTGWVAFTPDGRYKMGGDLQGSFWHVIGLCRFEPGELTQWLPGLRMNDDEPLLPD